MKSLCRSLLALVLALASTFAGATCSGKFYNPVIDVCWSCMFPIEVFGKSLFDFGQLKTAIDLNKQSIESCDPSGFTCRCGEKCGIPIGFYEPARHYDVTKTPGCMPGIGTEVDMSALPGGSPGTTVANTNKVGQKSFAHVNVYVDPVLAWAGLVSENPCLEHKSFDLAYFTPADVCWEDEDLCNFLEPDSFLFGNLLSTLACTADCVMQSAAQLRNELTDTERWAIRSTYWCAGCNGHTFPISGRKSDTSGDLTDTQVLGQRVFTKMHRQFMVWGTSGPEALCSYYPKPMIDKNDYKAQMLFPSPQTEKIFGRCCQMFGATTNLWGVGKTWPITGEDYSFMVFRRRDCCIGQTSITETLLR